MKNALILIVCAIALAIVSHAQPAPNDPANDPRGSWQSGAKLSPFEAIRWQDTTPQVQVKDIWYELVSLDDIPSEKIVSFCQSIDKKDWQKRFDEDLPAVLFRMGHESGDNVKLVVKDLKSGEVQTLDHVAMTSANRWAIWEARNGRCPTTQPSFGARNSYPKVSPFQAVRWHDQTPDVLVNGTWYTLEAINDIPADQIVNFSRSLDAQRCQKHFEEDLVELLTRMGHQPGATATLKLKDSNGQEVVMKDVPMTEANRQALWKAGMEQVSR